jgi:hypothetical protein
VRIVTLSPVSFGRFQNCEFRFAPGINQNEAPNGREVYAGRLCHGML